MLPSGLREEAKNADPATRKRYSRAYPLYGVVRNSAASADDIRLDPDPDALVMTCQGDDLTGAEWADVKDIVQGVALLVVADGFYLWLALYDASDERQRNQRHAKIKDALKRHIRMLVGGDYFNRARDANEPTKYVEGSDEPTLSDYRDRDLGILSFFQLNLILEGMYNAALDPRVYLGQDDLEGNDPDTNKRKYSLGSFIGSIVTEAHSDAIDPRYCAYCLSSRTRAKSTRYGGELTSTSSIACDVTGWTRTFGAIFCREFLRITAPERSNRSSGASRAVAGYCSAI